MDDKQEQYDYVAKPTQFPVIQDPPQPPSPRRTDREPEETLNDRSLRETPNPMYGASGEHATSNTDTHSTDGLGAEEELVDNPMYGKSTL